MPIHSDNDFIELIISSSIFQKNIATYLNLDLFFLLINWSKVVS